jgi:uncharacterized protein YkwD
MKPRFFLSIALIFFLLGTVGCGPDQKNAGVPGQLPVSVAQRQMSILTPAGQETGRDNQDQPTSPTPETSEILASPTDQAASETFTPQTQPTSEISTTTGAQQPTATQNNPPAATANPSATATKQPTNAAPTNTSSASPTSSGSVVCTTTGSSSFETEVIQLINQERNEAGLPLLSSQAQLTNAARTHSDDMACNLFFSHTSAETGTLFDRLDEVGYGYSWAGENIAAGYASPAAVVEGWMASEGHRANILNENFTQIGVGYASWDDSEYGIYWTAVFASP